MWRYLAGGGAVLLTAAAGFLFFNGEARPGAILPAAPAAQAADAGNLPDSVPEASDRTREEKRFDHYDKDRDGNVTREEYLASRRKAYAKLDTNRDGALSFDEWAAKAEGKFTTADTDKSGAMNAAEFATTAVKRKTKRPVKCPPNAAPQEDEAQSS